MRVKLSLRADTPRPTLPLNSNHAVAGLIYRTLGQSSADFAARLHDTGFADEHRRFKLFTFSRLAFRRSHVSENRLVLDDPAAELQLSSPVGEFIEHFVAGLFQGAEFHIAGCPFTLTGAETVAPPDLTERNMFRALSPITESVRDEQGRTRFLTPDEDWSEVMQRNLLRKYRALHGREPDDTRLIWRWDEASLKQVAAQGRRASVLSDINGIKVRGWLAPFSVEGSRELIKLGYEAGFGSRNSMGFGMADVAEKLKW